MIIDEAHERSVNTDILLSCVKQAQQVRNGRQAASADYKHQAKRSKLLRDGEQVDASGRKPLKVIVMSAAMVVVPGYRAAVGSPIFSNSMP